MHSGWWSYEYDVMCMCMVGGGVTSMMSCVCPLLWYELHVLMTAWCMSIYVCSAILDGIQKLQVGQVGLREGQEEIIVGQENHHLQQRLQSLQQREMVRLLPVMLVYGFRMWYLIVQASDVSVWVQNEVPYHPGE